MNPSSSQKMAGWKTRKKVGPVPPNPKNVARNLKKSQLGGVLFGCKHRTIEECLTKQLFGTYIRNIKPGLPLFLFNYSNRKLHGIFEAAGTGQMNIDPYGWTADGFRRAPYPAQLDHTQTSFLVCFCSSCPKYSCTAGSSKAKT